MDRLMRRLSADRASAGSGDPAVPEVSGALPPVSPVSPAPPVSEEAESCCPIRAAREVLARPVRRRGKELENAIFEAALDQLTSGGYARLTMEGVAAAARTGKAALYRRWTSKVELVIDALDATLPRPYGIPDLGSARAELLQLIELFTDAICSPAGAALHALMAELSQQQAEVFKGFIVQRVIGPTEDGILEILRRGVERGDVRPDAVNPLVADVVPAMLMFQMKVSESDLVPDFAVRLVDDVLVPMVRRP